MSGAVHRFYRLDARESFPEPPVFGSGLAVWHWWPTWRHPLPPGHRAAKFLVWFLFDRLRVFRAPGYSVCLIEEAGKTVHRSCVFPRFFRFPFMGDGDLQVGDTWTAPSARGRGLATLALREICRRHAVSGTAIWYLVEDANHGSIKVVERVGFSLVGFGSKRSRCGLGILGYYSIDRPVEGTADRDGGVD